MNPILQIKLNFSNEENNQKIGGKKLRPNASVSAEKVDALIDSLKGVLDYYRNTKKIVDKLVVDVNYNDLVPKSRRIHDLLKESGKSVDDAVVGARFSDALPGKEKHIITYYVDEETVNRSIQDLRVVKRFINHELGGTANCENFNNITDRTVYERYQPLTMSKLRGIVVDCSTVDSFSVPHISSVPDRDFFLITLYRTELKLSELLSKLGVDRYRYVYDPHSDDTLSVSRDLFERLNEKVPYLISMISTDFSQVKPSDILNIKPTASVEIPDPQNEPIIGVIDMLFDDGVYFSSWVENIDCRDDFEKNSKQDQNRDHGTEVTSIIVDGPRMNPWLDDRCGRFRVRHFGVCSDRISTIRLVRKIREIVQNNRDIHVWNLSLGTEDETSKNFISYDAAALDELQVQYNVVFVISGTNDNRSIPHGELKVGSPADSLNSVVVNSVRRDGRPASYSRKGNVLNFFNKPDVSYYGGDYNERIVAYSPRGEEEAYGTSFAAPWISRKLCYLIDVMGFPREIAKALLIDSAAGWEFKRTTYQKKDFLGYGVAPIDINRILSTESGEIRFMVYGTSQSYRTSNYAIPVPRDEGDKYPYVARATLCYFPECCRRQGVDYTNRELSLKFGVVDDKGKIKDIVGNKQHEEGAYIDERTSRNSFRKWDNTKFISATLKRINRPKKTYGERLWGMTITSNERLADRTKKPLNFGAVITLKEIKGVNRIDAFIKACQLRGYIVNRIEVDNRIELFNSTRQEMLFE